MSDKQAFTGLRILDFTQVLAGPFATQQLAQLGADVIKIEARETGDITRGLLSSNAEGMAPSFLTCNLGKRSITLDLKHPSAKEIIFKLLERCDAVVENFKPGTIERLGFGYDALRARKPDIVYASISGYGQSGPKSRLPAYDGAIQAASGMVSISGHPESGPVRSGYFAVDMSTALNAAFAISAALFRRHTTGEGQRIDVAMMDTAMMMLAPQMSNYLVNGTMPELMGNASPTKQPTANVFTTSDGHVQVVGINDKHARTVMQVTGHAQLYDAYPEAGDRVKGYAEITEVLAPTFASKSTAYWLDKLNEVGVPVAAIRNLAESAADEQNKHRLSFTQINKPCDADQQVDVVSASHMAEPGTPEVQRPPPRLGEHTDEILTELGYDTAAITALRQDAVI